MDKYILHLGDCLEYMRGMEAGSIDAIITDLPYGTTACSWDVVIPLEPMWKEIERICKGVFITTASQPFTSILINSNLKAYKYGWIWNKKLAGNAINSDYQPLKIHEDICVFSRNGYIYNPILRKGDMRTKMWDADWDGAFGKQTTKQYKSDIYKPKSILDYYLKRAGRVHPTQKPVELYAYLIRTYTNPKNIVLDFVMGSGTTGVACMQTGRRFIGCEINPGYFAIAERRIKAAAAQMLLPFGEDK